MSINSNGVGSKTEVSSFEFCGLVANCYGTWLIGICPSVKYPLPLLGDEIIGWGAGSPAACTVYRAIFIN